ncbi:MAG: serine hydrolase domain-containing protein [Chloroflexota bacterium]
MAESAHGIDPLVTVVEKQMERWNVPGYALGILEHGEVQTASRGIANLHTGYEMRDDTILQIGSISKIFTTTLIMQLVDEGLIDLDSPVSRYLPGVRITTSATQDSIRVRQLFTHTSGMFGDHFDDFGWGDDALEKYVESLANIHQVYEPGSIWSYTNSGFDLAGRIVELLLDTTFEDAVRERIFKPLGMEQSFYFAHEAITYPVSAGHSLIEPDKDDVEVARRWPIPRSSGPAGSISSTVGDMLKFARFHLTGETEDGSKLLSDAAREAMQHVEVEPAGMADAWGLGWQINFVGGAKVIGHGGTTNGFQAHLDLVPEHEFAVVSLTNSARGAAAYREVTRAALKEYCGLEAADPPEINLEASVLGEYEGSYRQPMADIEVSAIDNGVQISVTSRSPLADDDEEERKQPPVVATPAEKDRLVIREGPMAGLRVDFIRRDDGHIRFIRFGGRVAPRSG